MSTSPRFRVRQQTSGYTGVTAYIVVSVHEGRTSRVSVHAFGTRETAQASADSLNAMEAQHAANLADPAWVAQRDRVLAEQEAAEQARSDAFARLIADQAERRAAADGDVGSRRPRQTLDSRHGELPSLVTRPTGATR